MKIPEELIEASGLASSVFLYLVERSCRTISEMRGSQELEFPFRKTFFSAPGPAVRLTQSDMADHSRCNSEEVQLCLTIGRNMFLIC